MSNVIEKAITWMESTAANNSHGYDQTKRWGPDYDCSSAVITAWERAGVPVKTKGATYTGNMYKVFTACGFRDVTSSVNLKTGAGLVRGDVLLNTVHHTAMYCGNGKEVEARINEKGKATGGKTGDQTGREFMVMNYRNYPWNYVLRYAGGSSASGLATTTAAKPSSTSGSDKISVDGLWGTGTTRKAQKVFKTTVDGTVSNQWACYKSKDPGLTTGWSWYAKPNGEGSQLIKAIQKWCGMSNRDGEIGPDTISAMQRKLGCSIVDGVVSKPSNMVKAFQAWLNKQ